MPDLTEFTAASPWLNPANADPPTPLRSFRVMRSILPHSSSPDASGRNRMMLAVRFGAVLGPDSDRYRVNRRSRGLPTPRPRQEDPRGLGAIRGRWPPCDRLCPRLPGALPRPYSAAPDARLFPFWFMPDPYSAASPPAVALHALPSRSRSSGPPWRSRLRGRGRFALPDRTGSSRP
jgi:hypothetical protein